jgi:hypothetical protein
MQNNYNEKCGQNKQHKSTTITTKQLRLATPSSHVTDRAFDVLLCGV